MKQSAYSTYYKQHALGESACKSYAINERESEYNVPVQIILLITGTKI